MTVIQFNTKESLVEALEKTRKTCVRIDAKSMRDRQKEMDDAEKKLQANLKKAKNFTYEQRADADFQVLSYNDQVGSSCEKSREAELDVELARVKMTQQKKFSVGQRGVNEKCWDLLHLDMPKMKSICDTTTKRTRGRKKRY
jgi:hypothetical protein